MAVLSGAGDASLRLVYKDANGDTQTVGPAKPLPVDIGNATLSVTADGVEIKNDAGNPIPTSVASRTPTTTSVASSASSVTILAANAARKGVAICNDSTASLRLSFSSPATSTSAFIVMAPSSFLLLDQQLIASGAIYGIWSAANGTAQVTEFV